MSIFDIFRRKPVASQSVTPNMAMQMLPVTINPTTPQQLVRHVSRLSRLYQSVEQHGDDRPDIQAEILRRKYAIASHGHEIPQTEAEALALLKQLGGA